MALYTNEVSEPFLRVFTLRFLRKRAARCNLQFTSGARAQTAVGAAAAERRCSLHLMLINKSARNKRVKHASASHL